MKKTLEKSTLDAKGEIHSALNSYGHICQFKLCVREKWKHKEVKIKCKSQSEEALGDVCSQDHDLKMKKSNIITLGYSVS